MKLNVCRRLSLNGNVESLVFFVINHFLFLHPNNLIIQLFSYHFNVLKKGCGIPNIRSPLPPS